MAFKIVIQLSAELYLLRIGQNRCSLFRTKFEKNLSKVPKNKFREQKLVDYDNGAGVANTLKKLIRSSYAILGLRMWSGRRWCVVTQTSQCEVLKPFLYLCSRMDANQHKPTFSMYLLHFPACLMTCKESARHLEAGDSLDS